MAEPVVNLGLHADLGQVVLDAPGADVIDAREQLRLRRATHARGDVPERGQVEVGIGDAEPVGGEPPAIARAAQPEPAVEAGQDDRLVVEPRCRDADAIAIERHGAAVGGHGDGAAQSVELRQTVRAADAQILEFRAERGLLPGCGRGRVPQSKVTHGPARTHRRQGVADLRRQCGDAAGHRDHVVELQVVDVDLHLRRGGWRVRAFQLHDDPAVGPGAVGGLDLQRTDLQQPYSRFGAQGVDGASHLLQPHAVPARADLRSAGGEDAADAADPRIVPVAPELEIELSADHLQAQPALVLEQRLRGDAMAFQVHPAGPGAGEQIAVGVEAELELAVGVGKSGAAVELAALSVAAYVQRDVREYEGLEQAIVVPGDGRLLDGQLLLGLQPVGQRVLPEARNGGLALADALQPDAAVLAARQRDLHAADHELAGDDLPPLQGSDGVQREARLGEAGDGLSAILARQADVAQLDDRRPALPVGVDGVELHRLGDLPADPLRDRLAVAIDPRQHQSDHAHHHGHAHDQHRRGLPQYIQELEGEALNHQAESE